MRDGSLVVNELAPRVHNSGHWTIEGAATSPVRAAHPGDLRAAARRRRCARRRRRWSTCSARARRGRPSDRSVRGARRPDASTSTSTTSGTVFERRKMGHVTALGATVGRGARHGAPGRRRASAGRRGDAGRRTARPTMSATASRRRRRRRRRQPLGLPGPRAGASRSSTSSSVPARAAGRVGPPDARTTCSATPRRRRARASG